MEFKVEKGHLALFGTNGKRPDWEYNVGNKSLQAYEKRNESSHDY